MSKQPITAPVADSRPADVPTMRRTVERLLCPDGGPDVLPPAAEVDTLDLTVRGQLALLIPEVEKAAGRRRKDVQTYCALACVGEARRKLGVTPGSALQARVEHARKLGRVLLSLCDHYERLGLLGEVPEQTALRRMGEHAAKCPTCRTRDDAGVNANLPCSAADRLYDAWRKARRGTTKATAV